MEYTEHAEISSSFSFINFADETTRPRSQHPPAVPAGAVVAAAARAPARTILRKNGLIMDASSLTSNTLTNRM
jgi:hypothetical protein